VEGDREQQFRTLGYTFWNREMVDALSAQMKRLVGSASGSGWWLELAAGTGRLAAELARSGVPVLATDDGSQEDARVGSGHRRVRCGTWVLRCSLREAVARFRPERVLVTWPPLGSGVTLDLLAGRLPGGEGVRVLVVIGERDGASELPPDPSLLPPGWTGERLPDVEQWLVGFLDPDGEAGRGEVWVYQRSELGEA